jgi:hypothetical protein
MRIKAHKSDNFSDSLGSFVYYLPLLFDTFKMDATMRMSYHRVDFQKKNGDFL